MINLIGYPERHLRETLTGWGEAPYRTHQILKWIYQDGATRFDGMTNLSKTLRRRLAERFVIRLPRLVARKASQDGTLKFLFETESGDQIESVWMPETNRRTLCISSQVGCRLGCTFCLTGTLGLKGPLTAGDLLGQYLAVQQDLPPEDRVTNIVLMGMGEPLDNYDSVVEALRLWLSPEALRFPTRKITLSTAGLVDKLDRFARENLPVNLAVSLNATDNATRNDLMPINRKFPIETLLACLRRFPVKPNRRITIEYVLLGGINDSGEDAVRLARLLRGLPCKINLIPFNAFPGSPYRAPGPETVERFQQTLLDSHYSVFVRKNRGGDILGACGQLAAQSWPVSAEA